MPRRDDLHKILIIGSGPIVIGQACEFDYSGTQACKALLADGFQVVLVNSNPATIMTDPDLATRTYIEPVLPEYVEEIIRRERPDALLPTVGGQTGLNVAVELGESGVLERYGVEMIGADLQAIRVAEDRRLFRAAMDEIGIESPRSELASGLKDAQSALERLGLPAVVRPSYTLGGSGGGIAFNSEEFEEIVASGLQLSPIHEVLIEESILGWKEFELEVMRDLSDNVVIICSIENVDPMGIHTGDSITVAPAQTLTDREYQEMRDDAIRIIRRVGVETGGSNIQFGVDPANGRRVVIEMNPRVSRSSALASKATGFPIAKIAAKLAVGYTLDEIPNDITLKTQACFEPTLDYVVVKIPRWNFEKFDGAESTLGTQMKSVGEAMSIGRTFREALLKGLRSLEIGNTLAYEDIPMDRLREKLARPNPDRLRCLRSALAKGWPIEEIHQLTRIDLWFLAQMKSEVGLEEGLKGRPLSSLDREELWGAKREGLSDRRLAQLLASEEESLDDSSKAVWRHRAKNDVRPVFKRVDTCAAEFESHTPYLYSTYETEDESEVTEREKIIILGSGPNRIGQGIEFDYCCCHAAFALRDAGYETVMINCNPETVSTDYDTSDRLYFEPLTFEDVMAVIKNEKPQGVIVQFGGQTPLKLALSLFEAGVPIIGTSPESIDLAEDRERFGALLNRLEIPQPDNGTARSLQEALDVAKRIGYPILVRPSYVLGGRAMATIFDDQSLERYFAEAVGESSGGPVLVDRFLEDAKEFDVDALCDGRKVIIAGILQHVEEAGIHSGDSTTVLPPIDVDQRHLETMRSYTRQLGLALQVGGLMNVQYALAADKVYVLEVNPRASRTVPFVSKACGVPLAKMAALVMTGKNLAEVGLSEDLTVENFFVKAPVFPFSKFPGCDPNLGPEMKSTGEVMGVDDNFGDAYAKAQAAAGVALPQSGTVFVSVNDRDKRDLPSVARGFVDLGFSIVATVGTAVALRAAGIECQEVYKVNEGRPNVVDLIKSNKIDLVLNTPLGRESFFDEKAIHRACIHYGLPGINTIAAGSAAVSAVRALQRQRVRVKSLQEYQGSKGPRVPGASSQEAPIA